jgi:hypothetical protein
MNGHLRAYIQVCFSHKVLGYLVDTHMPSKLTGFEGLQFVPLPSLSVTAVSTQT